MVVVVPVRTNASPTALDLAQRIAATVEQFERERPGTTQDDIRQALRIVISERGVFARWKFLLIALLALLFASLVAYLSSKP